VEIFKTGILVLHLLAISFFEQVISRTIIVFIPHMLNGGWRVIPIRIFV